MDNKNVDSNKLVKPLMILSAAGALFFSPGASASADAPLGASEACANGSCCPQTNTICSLDGAYFENYYFKSEGPCS